MEKFTHIICYFIIAFLFSLFISSNAEGLSCINLNGEECLIEQKCYGGEWVTADEERCCSGVCCFRSEMQEDVVLINGENQEEVTIERLSDDTIRVFYGAVISPEIGRPYYVDAVNLEGEYIVVIESVEYEFTVEFQQCSFSAVPLNKCIDGTFGGQCSSTKPKYCDNSGNLVDNCQTCECPSGYGCQSDGSCKFCTPGERRCSGNFAETCNVAGSAWEITQDCGTNLYCSAGSCTACPSDYANCDEDETNGCEVDLTSITNCGSCGNLCAYPNANSLCVNGNCQKGTCNQGYFDLDSDDSNGCEYACSITNGGIETCDGMDNNCNGQTDEGVLNACGGCGTVPVEVCDGIDNDCDGQTDEGWETYPERSSYPNTKQDGVCAGSRQQCSSGSWIDWHDVSNIVGYESPETSCSDGLDNDCDNEWDYDTLDRGGIPPHGDSNCRVGATAISVSDSNPIENHDINVDCTSNVANVNSISAYIGSSLCSWQSWDGNTARFSCNVGANNTANPQKTVKCTVDTAKSYQLGTDQTTTIDVRPSLCSGYSLDSSSCNADTRCEWCPECDGAKYNSLGGAMCVDVGSCSYSCYKDECGATCDNTRGGWTNYVCDDYCVGDDLYVRTDITNTCYDGDTIDDCTVTDNQCGTGTSQSCGTITCTYPHTTGSCNNPCIDAGTATDRTDASCGTCILSCSCESGYADLDNDISNGCELLPLIAPNKKSESLYSDKEIFLVSDFDWKNVLPFIPVGVWTEGDDIKKYPFLIYHDEYWNFDADSIIYFMQQYNPNKVTIVGETPQELDNLLIAERDFGAGLKQENIKRIDVDEHLFYWESFDTVVYVEDNYELALLASTYASLINAPLIIQGTAPDSADIFTGRDVICVGSVSPIGGSCSEQYTLEQLQAKYKTETNTDKIILINPSDWTAKVSRFLETDKSGYIFDLYSKTSLSAPILASAKHELILSRKAIPDSGKFEDSLNEEDLEKLFIEIDNFIEPHLAEMNYLTIMANLFVIPHRKYSHRAFGSDIYWALDQHFYADTDNDKESDVAVGRITGFTTSDVSSYVARDLFYDAFQKTNNMKFMASSFLGTLAVYTNFLLLVDSWSDYNTVSVTTAEEAYQFNPVEWENQDLIYYTDHGASSWSGIDSEDIPELKNSLVASASCSTVSTMKKYSFWAYAIRKGAIGYAGAVSVTYLSGNYYPFVKNIYQKNYPTIGDAFKAADSSKGNVLMTTLIGDPTLNLGVESRESCITKGDCADNICKMFTCGLQESGESCITNGDCADNTCKMFTCGLQQETEGCILHSHCASGLRCNWFTCKSCKSDDSSCTFNKECCSNDGCRAGTCGLQQDGEACNWNTDCAGNICRKDTCGYQAVGESCNWNTDCADNTCKMGTCGLQKIKEPCITKGDCVADSNCVGPPFDTICSSCLKGSVKVTIFNRGQCCNSWEWIQKAKTCRSSNCPVERHKWCRDSACGKGWFGITKLCVHPNCGSIYQRCEDAVGCGTKNDYQACK